MVRVLTGPGAKYRRPNTLNPLLATYAPFNPTGMPVPADFPDALEARNMAELAALNRLMGPARGQFLNERQAHMHPPIVDYAPVANVIARPTGPSTKRRKTAVLTGMHIVPPLPRSGNFDIANLPTEMRAYKARKPSIASQRARNRPRPAISPAAQRLDDLVDDANARARGRQRTSRKRTRKANR